MAIDLLALILAVLGFWYGKDRGIFRMVFWFLSVTFGLVLAYKMAPVMARILKGVLNSDSLFILPAAFIINVLFIWGLFSAAGSSTSGVFRTLRVGFVDRILGGMLSAFVALFLYGSILWFLQETKMVGEQTARESRTLPYLAEMPKWVGTYARRLKPFAEEAWGAASKWMEDARAYGDEKTRYLEPSPAGTDEGPRIYKIEEGAGGRIEKKPQDTRAKNRELYEDTGIEY